MNPAERERDWTILMEQSLQGKTHAYEQLLASLMVGLRAIVRRRAPAAGIDVEDVVQEVLLALHLKRGTWAPGTPVAPWVAAIARNKVVDALRRRGQGGELSIDCIAEALSAPEDNVEYASEVSAMLARLSERQRDVVRAVSLEGYSARETAQRLQMTEVAVRVTLYRSLKVLGAMVRAVPT